MVEGQKEAISPNVTERLQIQFPAGSPSVRLEQELQDQGFERLPPCESDASIHRAAFHQTGGHAFSYPIDAIVAWKVTGDGRIVWSKAHVYFTGP
jgi:hypothetical protein